MESRTYRLGDELPPEVELHASRWHKQTSVEAETTEDAPVLLPAVAAIRSAVLAAIDVARGCGRARLAYLTSPERAEADALANEREFTADGQLYLNR